MDQDSRNTSQIRRARPGEAEAITSLGVRSKATWNYSDAQMEVFLPELTITEAHVRNELVYVMVVDEIIVGYFSLQPRDSALVDLEHLFVEPTQFNKGYGRRLLKHALHQAHSRGFRRIRVVSDPNAEAFYNKMGIQTIGSVSSSIPGREIPVLETVLGEHG